MTTAPASPDLAAGYAATQRQLSTMTAAAVAASFTKLAPSPHALQAAVVAVVRSFGSVAAQEAVRYYQAERAQHAIRQPFRPTAARPATGDLVARNVDWATQPLRDSGDLDAALARTQGSAERLVLNTGRDTITAAVEQDRQARGWARSIGLTACSFCAMLATRGAVYKQDSFVESDKKFAGDVSTIKVHDHCHCFPTPVFTAYEPTARVRQLQADWKTVTKGRSGRDARLAWRAHIEGRQPARPGGE